jgi:hypothetical protein
MIIPSGIHNRSQRRHPCAASRTYILKYHRRFGTRKWCETFQIFWVVIEKTSNVPPVVAVMVPVSLGQNWTMCRKEYMIVSNTVGRQSIHQECKKEKNEKERKDNGSTQRKTYTLGKFRSLIGCHSTKYYNHLMSKHQQEQSEEVNVPHLSVQYYQESRVRPVRHCDGTNNNDSCFDLSFQLKHARRPPGLSS